MAKTGRNRYKKNTLFTSLFISYVVVFLVPILVAFLISTFSSVLMLGQIMGNARSSSEHAKNIIDSHVENSFFNASCLLTNDTVTSIRYKETFDSDDITELHRLQLTIGQMAATDFLVSDFYIIFNKSGAIVSSDSVIFVEDFAYYSQNTLHVPYEEFRKNLLFEGPRNITYVESRPGEHLIFLYNKNTRSAVQKDTGVTVMGIINPDAMRSALGSLSDPSKKPGFVTYLTDDFGNILESGSPYSKNPGEDIVKKAGNSRAQIYSDILFGKSVSFLAPSEITGFNYLFVQNQTGYTRSVLYTIWICAGIIVIGMILGIRFCLRLTRKQYSPMQMLIDRILYSTGKNSSTESSISEFELIEHSLNNLVKQKSTAEEQAKEYKSSLAESMLREILKGNTRGQALNSLSHEYGYDFSTDRFRCILYSVENINLDLLGKDDSYDESILDLVYAFIHTLVNEYVLEGYTKYVTNIDGFVVCLLCPLNESAMPDISMLVNETAAHIKQNYDVDLLIGISNLNAGPNGIARSYEEARAVIDYSNLLGLANSIMYYREIPQASEADSLLMPVLSEYEHRYYNCIKGCDFKNAAEIQDEIVQLCFRDNRCTKEQTRYRLYGLINVTMSALEEIKPLLDSEFWDSLDVSENLLKSSINLTGFISYSNELYGKLQEYFEGRALKQTSERDAAIVAYVEKNYTDPGISIALLADHFDMSPSYLSKTFKKITGMGLLDYIHTLRLKKAKELIRDTDCSLKDISEQVGYSNNLTMIRAFKRYEGINPSTYKENRSL